MNIRSLSTLAALLAVACTSHDGASCLLGPCTSTPGSLEVDLVVGYPDSLMSKDRSNHIGVLGIGDTVVLRYVHSAGMPFGTSVFEWACSRATFYDPRLRWAVNDSSVANITALGNGLAVLRAKRAGRFELRTTTLAKPVDGESWVPYFVACPSGEVVGPVEVR